MTPLPPHDASPAWLEWLRRNIWVLSFVAGALTITIMRPFLRHVPEPPPVLFELDQGQGALVDHRGAPFDPAVMRGKVWVAAFVFTRCPSTCPAVTRAMLELRERFDRNRIEVELVSVSVDPEHDTPEVLAGYARSVGAEHPRWRFVTGPKAEIQRLVEDGFRLGTSERTELPSGLFDIAHSTKLVLVDEDGGVRGYYGLEPEAQDELYERADRVWMETKRRPPVWARRGADG